MKDCRTPCNMTRMPHLPPTKQETCQPTPQDDDTTVAQHVNLLQTESKKRYRRSGNFRVKKLSYDKFSCKNIFVGTTPYRTSINSGC